jgi:GNAT superfamily N-acetyltransferase
MRADNGCFFQIFPMTCATPEYPLIDLGLARRLERTEAGANAAFVTARGRMQPQAGATWTEIAGAYAMFDGVGSPLTQSFGAGLFAEADDAALGALEAFFRDRGAEVFHEISPLADPSLIERLTRRGYRPVELTSILFRPVPQDDAKGAAAEDGGLRVRITGPDEADLWASTAAAGWSSESPEIAAFVREMGQVSARAEGTFSFLAEVDGRPVAAGGLSVGDGVALLAGASTIPAMRGRGAQRALLQARLGFAAEQGCDLVMIGAAPGSASQRNAERQGFRMAYTRIKWHLPTPA